jgi:multiple sugar transport system substrate-binding protein
MRKSIKVLSLVVALFMVFGLGLTGCGDKKVDNATVSTAAVTAQAESTAAPAEPVKDVTIRYGLWGSEAELKVQTDAAVGSEKIYPGLKIEVTPYPSSDEFWKQLPAQVAAKTAPDIIQLTNEGHIEYIVKGSFAPIDTEIKEAGLDIGKYSDAAKQIWTYDNKMYGLPMGAAPAMFFINKDMWDAAGLKDYPKTWDEVAIAAKALTKKGQYGLIFNIDAFHFTNYALSFGGGWDTGKTINSDANVKALEFIVKMFQEKIATSPKAEGLGWDGEVFSNKKGAMSTGGYWYKGFLAGAAPDIKYVCIPVPQGTQQGQTMHSAGIAILSSAADKVAAVKAAAYMSREECLSQMMTTVGLNPALTSLTSKYYEANPEFKAIADVAKDSKDFGYPAQGTKFRDALVNAMEAKILKNDNSKTVKQILDELQEKFGSK